MQEFLAALKAKPKLSFASAGTGTPGFFAGETYPLARNGLEARVLQGFLP
jgi:hypothetical protein